MFLLYLDKEDSNKQLTQLERFGFVVKSYRLLMKRLVII